MLQETLGHRGRRGDPLFGIRMILRCGIERLTEKQRARLTAAIDADDRHTEVLIAGLAALELRSAFHHKNVTEGRRIAEHVLDSFPSCPIPEIARLGRTLNQWREPFLAYFTTARANNGGTEAVIPRSPPNGRRLPGSSKTTTCARSAPGSRSSPYLRP